MGGTQKGGRIPLRLARGAKRFAAWRRTREMGRRIPERLWKLAGRLAVTHGVCRTAAALGLDYYGLKRRVQERPSLAGRAGRKAEQRAFVELPVASLAGTGECVLEFENARGSKLRVQLKGGPIPDLVALGRSIWDAER